MKFQRFAVIYLDERSKMLKIELSERQAKQDCIVNSIAIVTEGESIITPNWDTLVIEGDLTRAISNARAWLRCEMDPDKVEEEPPSDAEIASAKML